VTAVPEAFKSFIAAKIFVCGIIRDSKWRAARCLKKTYNKETKNRNLISRVSKWRAARCLKKSIIREKQRIISLARKPFLTQLTFKVFFEFVFLSFFLSFFSSARKRFGTSRGSPFIHGSQSRSLIDFLTPYSPMCIIYIYVHVCVCVY